MTFFNVEDHINFFKIKKKDFEISVLFEIKMTFVSNGSSPVAGVGSVGVRVWIKPWEPLHHTSPASGVASGNFFCIVCKLFWFFLKCRDNH